MKRVLVASIALALLPMSATAADIRVLSAASMQTVFKEVLAEFERVSGHKVAVQYATMGAITKRVQGGETADLVISNPASIATLVAEGRIDPASKVQISKTGVGIVVRSDAPRVAVASAEDFKRALLAARVVVYADPAGGGAAGIHIARLIGKYGIADALKPKTRLAAGGDVAEVTMSLGDGALGLTQVSEIAGKPGMRVITMPEELQNYTGFVAGTPAQAAPSPAVGQFIEFLKTPAVAEVMLAKGMKVDRGAKDE